MPHVLLAVFAGAGLYAGYRWAVRVSARAEAFRAAMQSETERGQREAQGPRDLGTLEYDSEAKVYKPRAD